MRLLSIAAHDPVHGAGLTADLATWAALGLDGASVLTALTVQNSRGLTRVEPVSPLLVRQALQAVLQDGEPAAIKIGLLGSAAVAREVTHFVAERRCPVVLDPVLAASNGQRTHDDPCAFAHALRGLMRHVDVITPNLPEALALLEDAPVSLPALQALCRGAVVLKGGHTDGTHSIDWVADAQRSTLLAVPRLPVSAHGTGCLYAAALAAGLAQGWGLHDAAVLAHQHVHASIAHARQSGPGRPQVNPRAPLSSAHLPALHAVALTGAGVGDAALPTGTTVAFASLTGPLGFYPVVPDADWVERLLGWGVRTVQLRIKAGALPDAALRAHIRRAVEAGRATAGAQVFINDHWHAALESGAYGVHLGQEDLRTAPLHTLRAQGLRLGLSTHTPAEMALAHAHQPSYVAIGPVFPTTLKAMPYAPVGLARLHHWVQRLSPRYPVVAIGGIGLRHAPAVWACGVDGLAVVSAITQAPDAAQSVAEFMALCHRTGAL